MPDRMNARKNVKCPNRCQIECQKECQIHIDRMSVYMPERMSHRMSEMDRHVIYCKMQNDLSELCQDSFSGLGSLNMEFYVCMYLSYTFEHLQVIHIEHCHILITMPCLIFEEHGQAKQVLMTNCLAWILQECCRYSGIFTIHWYQQGVLRSPVRSYEYNIAKCFKFVRENLLNLLPSSWRA